MNKYKINNAQMNLLGISVTDDGRYVATEDMETEVGIDGKILVAVGSKAVKKKKALVYDPMGDNPHSKDQPSVNIMATMLKLYTTELVISGIHDIMKITSRDIDENNPDISEMISVCGTAKKNMINGISRLLNENVDKLFDLQIILSKKKYDGYMSAVLTSPMYTDLVDLSRQAGRPRLYGVTLTKYSVSFLVNCFRYLIPGMWTDGHLVGSGKSVPTPQYEALVDLHIQLINNFHQEDRTFLYDPVSIPKKYKNLFDKNRDEIPESGSTPNTSKKNLANILMGLSSSEMVEVEEAEPDDDDEEDDDDEYYAKSIKTTKDRRKKQRARERHSRDDDDDWDDRSRSRSRRRKRRDEEDDRRSRRRNRRDDWDDEDDDWDRKSHNPDDSKWDDYGSRGGWDGDDDWDDRRSRRRSRRDDWDDDDWDDRPRRRRRSRRDDWDDDWGDRRSRSRSRRRNRRDNFFSDWDD